MSWQDYLTLPEILKKLENFRGSVESISDLPLVGNKRGDLILVMGENKGLYWWNGDAWEMLSGLGGGDNLGNHVATMALDMNSFDILNAGNIYARALQANRANIYGQALEGNVGDILVDQQDNLLKWYDGSAWRIAGGGGTGEESYWVREGDCLRPRDGLRVYALNSERAIIGCASYCGVVGNACLGYGVYGNAPYCGVYGSAFQKGIYGSASDYGVYGNVSNYYGVYGSAYIYGVYGDAYYFGLYGHASSCYGVYGGAYWYGVYGCASFFGIYGCAYYYGVYGCATYYGVVGYADLGPGVFGCAACYGVYGRACWYHGVYGCAYWYGVYGRAFCYGVYGEASFYAIYGYVCDQSAVGLGTNGILKVTSPYASCIYKLSVGNVSTPTARLTVGGSIATRVLTVSSDYYSLTENDSVLLVDASANSVYIVLPQASSAIGRQYIIKKIDSSANEVRIVPLPEETIEGLEFIQLSSQYESVTLVAGENMWYRI
jgi:hypothetical protein